MDIDKVEEQEQQTTPIDDGYYEARPYQIKLLEAAIESNTIVLLGTGAGKTFIAVMLIKQLSAATFRPLNEEGAKRTVFLVNTVPLVSQQSEYIEKHTPLKVGRYWGEMGVDYWQNAKWWQELDGHNILVMTRQIFLDALTHAFVRISQINLIVFDECHHAVKKDAYARIMEEFYFKCPSEDRPHILGLTASIISGKCKPGDLTTKVKELEKKLNCRTETADDLEEVAKYATNPEEALVTYDSEGVNTKVSQLRTTIENLLIFFNESCLIHKKAIIDKEIRDIIEDCLTVLNDVSITMAIETAKCAVQELNEIRNDQSLCEWENGLVAVALTRITIFIQQCRECLNGKADDHSPKFTNLLGILSNVMYSDTAPKQKLCGIIFVQKRSTAVCLSNTINSLSKEYFPRIHSDFIVGHGTIRKTGEQGNVNMNTKKQQLVLKKFRNETVNLLVATSVVEEGLDIRKCNLVVRYDFPLTFQSYVQSKGRARSKNSQYLLLVDKKECNNCRKKLAEYTRNEKELQSICHDRSVPEEDELELRLKGYYPHYTPLGEEGPRLTVDGSLSLLHKYCQKLPHDQFTLSAPDFHIRKLDGANICILDGKLYPTMFIVTVCLPMNCPIREKVEGPALPRLKLAQKAAALETIKKLYLSEELDDNLKPVSHKEIDSDEEDDTKIERKAQHNAGTTKKKTNYEIEVASCLINSYPLTEPSNNNLYVFLMTYKDTGHYYRCREGQSVIQTMGILTSKPLPYHKIPEFSLYLGKTEVTVSIHKSIVSFVNESDLKRYRSFQEALFNNVLKISHFKVDTKVSQGYLVVPVSMSGTTHQEQHVCFINEDIVNYVIKFSNNEAIKPKRPFDLRTFKNALISKSYTEEIVKGQTRLYEVIKINEGETPLSLFPHNHSLTYAQYFDQKYNYKMETSINQFSITCKPVSTSEKSLQLTNSRFKQAHNDDDQHIEIVLFPELCNIHPLKANTLYLFRCVPSLLYRVESLLMINEFSDRIIDKTGIGLTTNEATCTLTTTVTNVSTDNQQDLGGTSAACYSNHSPVNDNKPTIVDMIELKSVVRSPNCGLLLQAVTPASANDCINLERLEVLGDSFLKFATSINLFCSPIRNNHHEGKLSMARQRRISNFNLWYLACRKDIPGKILSRKFGPLTSWIPSCFMPLDKMARPSKCASMGNHQVSDKGVADTVEALLGAYIIAGGIEAGFMFFKFLGLKMDYPLEEDKMSINSFSSEVTMKSVPSQDSLMSIGSDRFNDIVIPLLIQNSQYILPVHCYPPPPAILKEGDHTHTLNKLTLTCGTLFDKLQWEFGDKGLLFQALTHPSYIKNEITDSYQRLEFLGDAILDYLITCYIYGKFPEYSPGKITEMRSAMVNNVTFAEIAIKELELHKYLLHTSPNLFGQIAEYSDWLEKVWKKNEDEKKSILLCRSISYKTTKDINHAAVHYDPTPPSLQQSMSLEGVEYEETAIEEEDTLLIDEQIEEIDPPKALGDILESIIGALFLDCGMSLELVWSKIHQFFQPLIEKYSNEGLPIPPIQELYDTGHSIEMGVTESDSNDGGGSKRYRCTIKVIDKRVQVTAVAKTLKLARKAAAKRALKILKMIKPSQPVNGNE